MKSEKGILGRLLAVTGAILVVVGVFVFQGASNAEDDITSPADTGLGLTTGTEPTEPGEPVEPGEPADPADPAPITYDYVIKYLEKVDDEENELFSDTYSGVEEGHTFVVTDVVPEGEGEFLAWYDTENDKVYTAGEEITLTKEAPELNLVATFKVVREYTLKYDSGDGLAGPADDTCKSDIGTCDFRVSDIKPVRDGYEFVGWQKADERTITYVPGSSVRSRSYEEPLILKAIWAEIKTYTLIYEANGGSGAPEAQVCKSATGQCKFVLSDKTPTRSGFNFIDWQKGTDAVGPNVEITATEIVTIVVANWNPIVTFTLEYVADDAKDVPEPQKCETSEGTCTFIIPDKTPTKEGYKFRGWRFEDKEDMLAKAGDELIVGVDGSLELKVVAVWLRLYPVLNSGEVFGAGERVIIRAGADYSEFDSIEIDGEPISEDYFTVTDGGATSVILGNAFAQSLSAGEHSFKVTWKDGEANGIISVNQTEDGSKRFVIVDGSGNVDGISLMLRPKAGAVSRESIGAPVDSAKDNQESNFDAVRTLIMIAVGAFVVIYIVNRFYIRRKMDFIEEF